jgi:hypothetical protein
MNLQRVAVACIATALFGVTPAHAGGRPDHLLCYKMTDTLAIAAAVDMIADLQPQFTQRGCRLVKPVEFCVPATKQNVQPPPAANDLFGQPLRDDYVCYLAKCPKAELAPANQILADQFGVRPASKLRATKVCVPATKFPLRCGASGSRACNGACPPGEQCTPAANGCNCQPAPCEGRPDKAGMCGGTCPDSAICRLTTTDAGRVACTCQRLPPPPCGKNPLSGSCGGDCTDPTLKCLPDANDNCGCRQAPDQFCGPVAGATCGGPCPNPSDKCVASTADPNKPCICEPGPCHQDTVTGTCTGTCDPASGPGATCHLDQNNQCTCGPPPCGVDPATGECGGPCPPGQSCAPDAANQCTCTGPCRFDTQNVCGGACPPSQVCKVQGQECLCVQPPPCNFGAEAAGFCSGACPPGTTCHTQQNKSSLACLCLDN